MQFLQQLQFMIELTTMLKYQQETLLLIPKIHSIFIYAFPCFHIKILLSKPAYQTPSIPQTTKSKSFDALFKCNNAMQQLPPHTKNGTKQPQSLPWNPLPNTTQDCNSPYFHNVPSHLNILLINWLPPEGKKGVLLGKISFCRLVSLGLGVLASTVHPRCMRLVLHLDGSICNSLAAECPTD